MTRVGFYILSETAPQARQRFACRLLARGYRDGLRAYVHMPDRESCRHLDELLWTFRDQSFVPHEVCTGDSSTESSVVIGHDREPSGHFDFIVNLADVVPHFFSRYERALEVIDQQAETKRLGRERFKFYRDRGYPLETHNI